jgi:hypothetical protein
MAAAADAPIIALFISSSVPFLNPLMAAVFATPMQLDGPLRGAPHAGKSGAVARRGRCFLAQLSPLFSLIQGPMVGLRIVATSTRVRLFPIPVWFLRAIALM